MVLNCETVRVQGLDGMVVIGNLWSFGNYITL